MTTTEESRPTVDDAILVEIVERITRGAPPYVPELDDYEDPPLDVILSPTVDERSRHRFILCPTCGVPLVDFRMPDHELRPFFHTCEHVEALYWIHWPSRKCHIVRDPMGYLQAALDCHPRSPSAATFRRAVTEWTDGSIKSLLSIRTRRFPGVADLKGDVLELVFVVLFDRGWGEIPPFIRGRTDFRAAEERFAAVAGKALPTGDLDLVKRTVLSLPPAVAGRLAELPRAWERFWRHLFQVRPCYAFDAAAALLTESTGVVMTADDVRKTAGVFLETWWNETVVPHLPRALPHLLPFERDHSFADPANVVTPWLLWECLGGRDRLDLGAARNVERYRPGRLQRGEALHGRI